MGPPLSEAALGILEISSNFFKKKNYCLFPKNELHCARLGFANLDSARQSTIDSTEEDHSRMEKADEENRLCKVAASPNSQNLSGAQYINSLRKIFEFANEVFTK